MARTPGYDPTAHVPAGIILDSATHNALMDAWIAKGEDLTSAEIEVLTGAALPAASLRVEFGTGQHPNEGVGRRNSRDQSIGPYRGLRRT